MALKLAHLSDIHFFHFCKNPLQFFSKRFIGNFHSLCKRGRKHNAHLAYQVVDYLKKLGVTHLVITGDYTTTGSKKEFIYTKNYLKFLKSQGLTIYTIPGNHDIYTKRNELKNSFYHIASPFTSLEGETHHTLAKERVASFPLHGRFHLLLMDCSCATPFHKSTGVFSEYIETSLIDLLTKLPKDALIIMATHYPYDPYKFPKAHLERGEKLETVLAEDSRICLYLHGHRHLSEIIAKKGHTVVDSGSISFAEMSSFNLLTLSTDRLEVQLYKREQAEHWDPFDGKEIRVV